MDATDLREERVDSAVAERDWRTFVKDHPLATPYHRLAWRDAIDATFDYDSRYYLVYDDDRVVAAVPGFRVPEVLGRSIVNPFCEYGFPLLASGTRLEDVLSALKRRLERLDALLLKDGEWTGISGYSRSGFGGIETGIVRRLSVDFPYRVLFDDVFHARARRNVRRARNENVSVDRADSVDEFYRLYVQTMKRKGSPQFPRSVFEHVSDAFGDDFALFLARRGGEPIAGITVLETNDTLSLWTAASDEEALESRPNDLLYARMIRDACESEVRVVDFGRSEPESGVDHFKEKFGGRAETLVTFGFPPSRVDRGDISGYKRLEPVARRLSPVTTHETIGPKLKRFIHE